MVNGEGLLPHTKKYSLLSGNEAESPRYGQALRDLVRDQCLLTASSEAHGPASGQTGNTRQSELNTKRESLRWTHHHDSTYQKGFMNTEKEASAENRKTRARSNLFTKEKSIRILVGR